MRSALFFYLKLHSVLYKSSYYIVKMLTCFDTGFQALPEILQNSCYVFWSDFIPSLLQSMFQRFNGFVFERACFLLQETPSSEVQHIEITVIELPNILHPEAEEVRLTLLESCLHIVGKGSVAVVASQCFLHSLEPRE